MVDYFMTVLAKKEVTYATDAVPTPAANFILTRNAKITPISIDLLQRNLDIAARGAIAGVPTNEAGMISYEMELQSSGTAGTAPPWMVPLEGCGMAAPTIIAATSAAQRMAAINAALSSVSHYGFIGNMQHKLLGCRGDITNIEWTAGQYPIVGVDFMGLVPAATPWTDTAPGVPTLTAWKDPVEVNTANTIFSLDGYAAILKSFSVKANAEVKLRNLVNARYIQRGNHEMKGNLVIEPPSFAAKNYLATLRAGSRVAISIAHGLGAGFITEFYAGFLQITSIETVKEDDILMYNMGVTLTIGVGQDDFNFLAR